MLQVTSAQIQNQQAGIPAAATRCLATMTPHAV